MCPLYGLNCHCLLYSLRGGPCVVKVGRVRCYSHGGGLILIINIYWALISLVHISVLYQKQAQKCNYRIFPSFCWFNSKVQILLFLQIRTDMIHSGAARGGVVWVGILWFIWLLEHDPVSTNFAIHIKFHANHLSQMYDNCGSVVEQPLLLLLHHCSKTVLGMSADLVCTAPVQGAMFCQKDELFVWFAMNDPAKWMGSSTAAELRPSTVRQQGMTIPMRGTVDSGVVVQALHLNTNSEHDAMHTKQSVLPNTTPYVDSHAYIIRWYDKTESIGKRGSLIPGACICAVFNLFSS